MEEMQKLLSAIESASLTNRSVAHPAPAAAAPHRRLLDADDTHHNPPQMTNPVVGLQLADLSAGVPMRHSQSMYSRQPVNARPSRPNLPEKIRTQSLQTSNLDQDHKIMSPKSPTATSRVSSLFVNMTTGRHAPSSPHPTLTRAATVIPSTPTTPQVVGFESIPQVLQTSLPTKLSFHSALAGRSAAAPAMAIRQPTSSSELLPNPHSHAISASAPNPRPVHPDTPRAASLHIAESNDQLRIISPKWLRWLPGKLDESMLVDPSQGSFVDSQVPLSPTVDHHLDDEDPVQLEKERVKQWHQQYTDET
ncbi:uncharacterized protein BJ171DRAFT_41729 [Polychytrium aggregatum]|uniref:uncharacterized protein n=1 Tax=Polychytrium aggregatum TaxID=110093 RepID=UPI0022FE7855|nr:uncharacterized protein BJ171DRAFT_41729 [Polychytrium aggregatum]KAI9206131.1 hypothetical protein BJ171DRAFT_41729 [Polychytrium aggregatum]